MNKSLLRKLEDYRADNKCKENKVQGKRTHLIRSKRKNSNKEEKDHKKMKMPRSH